MVASLSRAACSNVVPGATSIAPPVGSNVTNGVIPPEYASADRYGRRFAKGGGRMVRLRTRWTPMTSRRGRVRSPLRIGQSARTRTPSLARPGSSVRTAFAPDVTLSVPREPTAWHAGTAEPLALSERRCKPGVRSEVAADDVSEDRRRCHHGAAHHEARDQGTRYRQTQLCSRVHSQYLRDFSPGCVSRALCLIPQCPAPVEGA